MQGHKTTTQGFTVIEVVIVILVVGIVSAVAMVRAMRSDVYNAAITRDQIVSMARSAQQKAIGRSDVELVLQPIGNILHLRILDSSGEVQASTSPLASVGLRADINQLASCNVLAGASEVTPGSPFVLRYNYLGDLLEGGPSGGEASVSTGARMCINGDSSMSVCLSAVGFAYVGDCVDVD